MSPDPGVPYGSGPEEAAADAEPTTEHQSVQSSSAAPTGAAAGAHGGSGPTGSASSSSSTGSGAGAPLAIPGLPADRPELHVAAAFAGGLLLATILKRLAR